jgi:penicillin-binding protein 1B
VGVGQASEAYLGKELNSISLPEAAEIAGMIQRPGYFDPFRHPDRLRDRRNVVLQLMRQNNVINDRDYALAIEAPLTVTKTGSTSVEAPYFVDMVNDRLQNMFQYADFQSNAFRVYTTIDMRVQRAAVEAVRLGMASVDEQIRSSAASRDRRLHAASRAGRDRPAYRRSEGAGGRTQLWLSQLNHSLAERQPGRSSSRSYTPPLDTAVRRAACADRLHDCCRRAY